MSKTYLVILAASLIALVAAFGAAPVETQLACDDWGCAAPEPRGCDDYGCVVGSEAPPQLACEDWGCVVQPEPSV